MLWAQRAVRHFPSVTSLRGGHRRFGGEGGISQGSPPPPVYNTGCGSGSLLQSLSSERAHSILYLIKTTRLLTRLRKLTSVAICIAYFFNLAIIKTFWIFWFWQKCQMSIFPHAPLLTCTGGSITFQIFVIITEEFLCANSNAMNISSGRERHDKISMTEVWNKHLVS